MKRYIAAVLIPCVLLQLCGCYSFNEITIDKLKEYKGSNKIRIKTYQEEYRIERKSGEFDPMDWEVNDSSIIIKTKEQEVQWEKYYKLVDKFAEVKINEIESIEIDEFDWIKTSILITGIAVIVTFGVLSSSGLNSASF